MPDSRTPKPHRILFTIPNFITAGSGQVLVNIAERLDRSRFQPSVCVLKTGGMLEERIHAHGIPLLELPFAVAPRPLAGLPARLWRAAGRFRSYHFDLWHSWHYSDDYTEPLIARLVGARAWIYTKKAMVWGSRAWVVRSLLATRIPAMNTAMIERFFSHPVLRRKTQLLPPSVNTEEFQPGVPARLAVRQNLGVGKDEFLIGCVAHLVAVKGHPTLLRPLAGVPGAHLLLAGRALEEDYVRELHKLCSDLQIGDRVHFLGALADVPALHAELDMFVLPTLGRMRMEGCPVALLEAMACSLPCVATDIPGAQDVIEAGISGLLVPPEEPEALAEAIGSLLQSAELRRRLGDAARKRILARYTIEREVADYEALYSEILNTST